MSTTPRGVAPARAAGAASLVALLALGGSTAGAGGRGGEQGTEQGGGGTGTAATAGPSGASGPADPVAPPPSVAPGDVPVASARLEDLVVADPVPPTRVTVPGAGIDMPVDPMGVDAAGGMEVPSSAGTAGWYRYGTAPGDPAGTTVVVAHVDTVEDGLGPFARLRDLRPGDTVTLTGADGTEHRYAVTGTEAVDKTQLPVDELFTREGPRRLVLITCGGPFDRTTGSYRDNVVVTADRA
ncbi:class F sortase [Cellulomonas endophytica]|uniref:class F sortase n=1 Tax=Cellulomonas endophytica TaxID=2494735 RepID=UPI001012E61F|nr:class F sortase [Cellulomonas endophytica]